MLNVWRQEINFLNNKHSKLQALKMMTCKILEWITNCIICKHIQVKKKKDQQILAKVH